MQIRRRDLIIQLEDRITDASRHNLKEEELRFIKNRLDRLNEDEKENPNGLIQHESGKCKSEGDYAPIDGNQKIDFGRYRSLKKGESIPVEGNWYRIGSRT